MSHPYDFVSVCPLDILEPEIGVCALVQGQQVALFRIDNQVFAIDNHDPFSAANVLSRGIVGDVGGEPVVASPIYKQHFRLRDGVCIEDESVKVAAHDVLISNDKVSVRLNADSMVSCERVAA